MTDVIDQAQAFDLLNLQQALDVQAARSANTPRLKAVGYCLNPHCCADEFEDAAQLYCGPSCADEHHRIMNPGARR